MPASEDPAGKGRMQGRKGDIKSALESRRKPESVEPARFTCRPERKSGEIPQRAPSIQKLGTVGENGLINRRRCKGRTGEIKGESERFSRKF